MERGWGDRLVDGPISGKLRADTRYLVVNKTDDDSLKNNPLVATANQSSIRLISAWKLVDMMKGN